MPLTIEIEDEPTPPQKFNGGDVVKGKVVIINDSGKCRLLSQGILFIMLFSTMDVLKLFAQCQ
jgi:hypothetical protein